ncbi:MAG: PIN domain-containing protein [Deltaproteobacteria bacterium]|nr:PIN domain-containing protein [Nannocystaceae bacterium]
MIVRVLVGDDPIQTRKAERAFSAHAAAEGVFISLVVLAEVSWVLRAAYAWEPETIHEQVSRLVRTKGVVVEELELVLAALDEYRDGKAGLADYLVLGKARRGPGRALLTFDRKLARERDVTLL